MKNNTLVIVVILVIVVVTIFAFYFVAQSKADKIPPSTIPRQQEISGWDLITNLVGLFKGKGKEEDGTVEEAEGFEEEGGTFGPPQP